MKKILFATLIMASANTYAGFYSGNRLLEELQSTDPVQHSYGVTYVLGVADIEELHVAQDSGKKRLSKAFFCLPGGVSSKQLSDVVRPFIENRPTVRHYNASLAL